MFSHKNYKDMADEALIMLYKKSESLDIVGELYNRYTALVYGVCLKYLKDREESRDAVMQIFEKLMVSLKTHDVAQFKPWLYVSAKNHCLMQLRSRKGKNFQEISSNIMETSAAVHLDDAPDTESDLSSLEKCISTLGNEQKTCVRLFYLEQKCYKEIADITGYDLNKVKSNIQNGKRNLKICMEQNGKS